MNSNETITITNKRIVDFFSKHQHMDPELTIVSFIEIMEKLYDGINNKINNTLVENLLTNIKNINNSISNIDSNISSFKSDTFSNFSLQMAEFRKEYIENLKLNLTYNVSDKIEPLIKEQMQILLDRTSTIFNDTLPKNNKKIQDSINETIKKFNIEVNNDAKQLLDNTIDKKSLALFIQNIDSKINNALALTERRLDDRITSVKKATDGQYESNKTLNNEVSTLLKKWENPSLKGKLSENSIFNILHQLYPTSQIDDVGKQKETGDIMLIRPNKPKILIENKNWGKNVVQEEIKKFIHDIETQKCSGVFLSQNHGIANKSNYEINIHDNNVLVYVQKVNNDPEKIKIAIDIVDHFKSRLDEINVNVDVDTIPKEKLDAINNEINFLASSKLSLISLTKDYNQKMLKQIDEIKIPTLEDYLSTRYANSTSKFVCEYCDYVAKNRSSLSAHKRYCKHKPISDENITITIDQNN